MVKEAIARACVEPEAVEEVIMGNVISAGLGQNPARQAALGAGLPPAVGALTINKVCGSGLKAVMLARQAIAAGDAHVIVAGGMESMSNGPYLVPRVREGLRLGPGQFLDATVHDGLWDVYNDFHMGMTGERVSEKYGVGRKEMDGIRSRQPPESDAGHQGREVQRGDRSGERASPQARAVGVRHR